MVTANTPNPAGHEPTSMELVDIFDGAESHLTDGFLAVWRTGYALGLGRASTPSDDVIEKAKRQAESALQDTARFLGARQRVAIVRIVTDSLALSGLFPNMPDNRDGTQPPEADATPDEAFELGRIHGYDEAKAELPDRDAIAEAIWEAGTPNVEWAIAVVLHRQRGVVDVEKAYRKADAVIALLTGKDGK